MKCLAFEKFGPLRWSQETMLTPEDRARIEEEERYRAEVRARLEPKRQYDANANIWTPPYRARIEEEETSSLKKWVILLLVIVVAGIGAAVLKAKFASSLSQASNVVRVPVHLKIATGPVVINPSSTSWYKISIPFEAQHARILGDFNVQSGNGGVHVALLPSSEVNLQNWINGGSAQIIWSNATRESSGHLDIENVPPGLCYLVFGNRVETQEAKEVLSAAVRYGLGGSLGALMNLLSPERQTFVERIQSLGENVSGVLSTFLEKTVSVDVDLMYEKETP